MKHLLALLLGLIALPVMAAPRIDDKTNGPALLGQAKSWNDLMGMIKEAIKNFVPENLAPSLEKEMLLPITPDALPWVNPAKPFGLYGLAGDELSKCRLVILVPVKGVEETVEGIKAMGVPIEKSKTAGIYDVGQADAFPVPVQMRVGDGYAYFCFGGADALEDKALLPIKNVINEKEPALAKFALFIERLPADLKKTLISQIVDLIASGKANIPDPELKEIYTISTDLLTRWFRLLIEQGRELSVKFSADVKMGDVQLDISVDAVPKTALADAIARRPAQTNMFGGMAKMPNAVQWYLMSAPTFHEDMTDSLVKLITLGEVSLLQKLPPNTPPEGTALLQQSFKSLRSTLKSGSMDMGMLIVNQNPANELAGLLAIQIDDAQGIEKAVLAMLKTAPEEVQKMVKANAGKIGDMTYHEISVPEFPEELKKFIGKDATIYVAVGKKAIYAAIGVDAKTLIKKVSELKPEKAAALEMISNSKETAKLMKRILGDLPKDANNPELDMMRQFIKNYETLNKNGGMKFDLSGGEKLNIKFVYDFTSLGMPGGGWMSAFMGVRAVGGAKAVPAK